MYHHYIYYSHCCQILYQIHIISIIDEITKAYKDSSHSHTINNNISYVAFCTVRLYEVNFNSKFV